MFNRVGGFPNGNNFLVTAPEDNVVYVHDNLTRSSSSSSTTPSNSDSDDEYDLVTPGVKAKRGVKRREVAEEDPEVNELIDRIDTISLSLTSKIKLPNDLVSIIVSYEGDPSYDIVKTLLQKDEIPEKFKRVARVVTALDLSNIIGALCQEQIFRYEDETIFKIYDIFKNVVMLSVPTNITENEFNNVAQLKMLQDLVLNQPGLAGVRFDRLQELPSLRRLILNDVSVSNDELFNLRNIEELSLWSSQPIDTGLSFLENVRILSLVGDHLTDESLRCLANLQHLHTLNLTFNRGITSDGIASLRNLHLHTLRITGDDITNAFLKNLPNVQSLAIVRCPKITNHGLVHLAKLTNLRNLIINGCHISDPGLAHLKDVNLNHLDISDCLVTPAGLTQLTHIPNIREIVNRQVINFQFEQACSIS